MPEAALQDDSLVPLLKVLSGNTNAGRRGPESPMAAAGRGAADDGAARPPRRGLRSGVPAVDPASPAMSTSPRGSPRSPAPGRGSPALSPPRSPAPRRDPLHAPFHRVTMFGWGGVRRDLPKRRLPAKSGFRDKIRSTVQTAASCAGDVEGDSPDGGQVESRGERPRLNETGRNMTFGTQSNFSKLSSSQYYEDEDIDEDDVEGSRSSPGWTHRPGSSKSRLTTGVGMGSTADLQALMEEEEEEEEDEEEDESPGDERLLTADLTNIELLRLRLEQEEAMEVQKQEAEVEEEMERPVGAKIGEAEARQKTHTGHRVIDEAQTGMPVADVHNYQLYCQFHRMNIIMRPVADGAASAFIGTFEIQDPTLLDEAGFPILERTEHAPWELLQTMTVRHSNARGKTMATALKSSPYNPIKGSVPVHAQLSKVGAAQTELKMALEAALIEAEKMQADVEEGDRRGLKQNKQALTHVYARLKLMEGTAVKMFNKIKADSQKAMDSSRHNLQRLMAEYCKELAASRDKFRVSQMYVDTFNNSQFLGECNARYGPLREVIYFVGQAKTADVEKSQHGSPYMQTGLPMFVLLPRGCEDPAEAAAMAKPVYRKWVEEREQFEELHGLPEDTELFVVKLVSSRQFMISPATGRIEESGEGAMLVPDYDGLVYAEDREFAIPKPMSWSASAGEIAGGILQEQFLEMMNRLNVKFVSGQGMVNQYDGPYIEEMRSLTDWKQNHGVEAFNIVKTQHFLPGNYANFRSNGELSILTNFEDVIVEYRGAWQRGVPYLLNPNWNVLLDDEGLPVIPDESNQPLYDLDERDASLLEVMRSQTTNEWDFTSIKSAYERLYTKDYVEHWTGVPRMRDGKKATELEVWRHYVKYRDEKKIIQMFFTLRALLLYPPYVIHERDVGGCADADQRAKMVRAGRLVQAAMRHAQNAKVKVQIDDLLQQKKVFEVKHGLKTTEFLDKIWDYLMLNEVEGGYCPNVPQPGDENSGFRDYEVIREAKAMFENAGLPIKASTATQIDPQINKGATQLTGEHHGLNFLSKANEHLPFTGHNPWSYPQSELVILAARDAVEQHKAAEIAKREKEAEKAPGRQRLSKRASVSEGLDGLIGRASFRNSRRYSSMKSMGGRRDSNAAAGMSRSGSNAFLHQTRKQSQSRGSLHSNAGGTGIAGIDEVLQELEEGRAALSERRLPPLSASRNNSATGDDLPLVTPRIQCSHSRRSSNASNATNPAVGIGLTPRDAVRMNPLKFAGQHVLSAATTPTPNDLASRDDLDSVAVVMSVQCSPAPADLRMESPRRVQFNAPVTAVVSPPPNVQGQWA